VWIGVMRMKLPTADSRLTIRPKQEIMKKTFLYYLLAVTLIASCRKDTHVFDKSPDERINETLTAYQQAISGSAYGWNGNLVTGSGGFYRFYFSFDNNNRVKMYSDWDSSTASVLKESSYRLKALQQPSLIFDTYSYIHILADPDAGVNGGTYGVGLKSDFEFRIDTVTADSISLTGRQNGSKLSLRKATQGDLAVWQNKQVQAGVVSFRNFWKFLLYWRRLNYGGTQYELQFDSTSKNVTISWMAGGQAQTVKRGYYFWANGVSFSDPVVNGSQTVPGFTITGFNGSTQVMNVTVNGTAATITGYNGPPINPDVKNAAARWAAQSGAGDNYWISVDGFHVNGVDDAYNIKSLKTDTTKYFYLLYKTNPGSVDAFFPVFLDSAKNSLVANYRSWLVMTITPSTGRTRFAETSQAPSDPWPAGPAGDTRTQMLNPNGFYFVQSSSYSYDMVSVADAKVWLTWYWIF